MRANKQVADDLGVSRSSVTRAIKVSREDPEAAKHVRTKDYTKR